MLGLDSKPGSRCVIGGSPLNSLRRNLLGMWFPCCWSAYLAFPRCQPSLSLSSREKSSLGFHCTSDHPVKSGEISKQQDLVTRSLDFGRTNGAMKGARQCELVSRDLHTWDCLFLLLKNSVCWIKKRYLWAFFSAKQMVVICYVKCLVHSVLL